MIKHAIVIQGNPALYGIITPTTDRIFKGAIMSENVLQISEKDFQKSVLEATEPVVVDFWAEWCGPCLALTPVLEQIAVERQNKIKIFKVNVEEAPELAARFNIRAIPFLAFIKNGQKVGELVGNQSKQNILKAIDAMVSGT